MSRPCPSDSRHEKGLLYYAVVGERYAHQVYAACIQIILEQRHPLLSLSTSIQNLITSLLLGGEFVFFILGSQASLRRSGVRSRDSVRHIIRAASLSRTWRFIAPRSGAENSHPLSEIIDGGRLKSATPSANDLRSPASCNRVVGSSFVSHSSCSV